MSSARHTSSFPQEKVTRPQWSPSATPTATPSEWKWLRIGDIAKIRYGKAKPPTTGNVSVVGSGGVYATTIEPLVSFPTLVIGRKGTAGMVWLMERPCWPSDTTFFLEWRSDEMCYRFVYFAMMARPLSGEHAKITLPSLQRADLESHSIPCPSLLEQRAIARVMTTVREAIDAAEAVIAATRALKASMMRHLFRYGHGESAAVGDVATKDSLAGAIPAYWTLTRLGHVAAIGNGSTPKRTSDSYWSGGTLPWLTSGKIHEGVIRSADQFVTDDARSECHLPLVPSGSVLVAITGQGKTLGNAALVTFDTHVSQHLAYLRFRTPDVLPEYVFRYLQTRYSDLRNVSGAGGSTKGALTCGFLKSYPLPVPPMHEQEMIVTTLAAVDDKLAAESDRKQALEAMFRSLLRDLMTGRRRVHDLPDDLGEAQSDAGAREAVGATG